MFGIYKDCVRQGFSLIEVLVAMALIVIMATILVPNLRPRAAQYERKQFIARLNGLTSFAWHHALATGRTQKIMVDIEKRRVQLQAESEMRDDKGNRVYQPVKGAYIATAFSWPKNLVIKNFYIEGDDEMDRFSGRTTGQTWFFIIPSGRAQAVTINFVDTKDVLRGGKHRPVGLVLNPFSAQFKEYDAFQKP